MSGIFGIVNLEGKVDREDLEKMSARLSHRGQDAHEIWMSEDGRVGFGHRMRWTVPENLHEPLPYEDDEGYVITADARLDNREELQVLLGWQHIDLETLGDSRLILGAYKKWGDQSPEKLKGDFAYVLWDPSKEKLAAGKDYFGVKPLFFYQEENLFCFASEIKGLLALEYIHPTLNQTEVDNYLNNLHYSGVPLETTFYEALYRILPAHSYHFSKQEKTKDYFGQRLWDSIEINVNQDDLPGEFRRVFQESIDQRIRCIGRVGSQLSGGLDSSSVSLLAAKSLKKEGKTLYTAYANSNVASSDESNYVQDVLDASDNMEHSSVDMLHPLESLEQLSGIFDEPLRMPCSSVNHAALEGLSSKNAKVVLTGHDGDSIVGYGGAYLSHLIDEEKWEEFLNASLSGYRNFKFIPDAKFNNAFISNKISIANTFIRLGIINQIRQKNYKKAFRSLIHCHKLNLDISTWINSMLFFLLIRSKKTKKYKKTKPSNTFKYFKTESRREYTSNWNQQMVIATEEMDKLTNYYNLECRHPFLSVILHKVCRSVKLKTNWFNGYSRGILRLGLKNILPKSILNRTTKVDFSGFIFRSFNFEENHPGSNKSITTRFNSILQHKKYGIKVKQEFYKLFHKLKINEEEKLPKAYT